MSRLLQDLTVTFRRLRGSPGFTLAAIVTLALGIGANAAIFTLVNTVVFRSFGVEHQNELVFFNTHTAKAEYPTLSYPDYEDYRARNNVLTDLALYRVAPMNVSRGAGKTRAFGAIWSPAITSICWALKRSADAHCIPRTTSTAADTPSPSSATVAGSGASRGTPTLPVRK